MLLPLKSSVKPIQMSPSLDTCWIKCPHLPSDIETRRGVRRSKEDPSKLEYIFGYDKITLTLKDSLLGIELPSDSVTKEGSIYEGNFFIQLRQRFKERHPHLKITIDLGDGHYDDGVNYKWCRENSSGPGFDHNTRNENLNDEALLKRGYDKNGTPFAHLKVDSPSGSVTIPKLKEAAFPARKSVFENAPSILFLESVLIGKMSTAFPLKCQLRPILASS